MDLKYKILHRPWQDNFLFLFLNNSYLEKITTFKIRLQIFINF